MPCPNAMCGLGSRVMSKRPASRNCLGSRFAEPIIGRTSLPGRDHLPVHLDVAPRRAGHPLERRAVAQDLLDRRGQEVGRCPEPGELVRVLEEAQDGVVDQVRGRLLAADEEELHEAQDLLVRQPLAVHLGLDEPGQQVVAARAAALGDQGRAGRPASRP